MQGLRCSVADDGYGPIALKLYSHKRKVRRPPPRMCTLWEILVLHYSYLYSHRECEKSVTQTSVLLSLPLSPTLPPPGPLPRSPSLPLPLSLLSHHQSLSSLSLSLSSPRYPALSASPAPGRPRWRPRCSSAAAAAAILQRARASRGRCPRRPPTTSRPRRSPHRPSLWAAGSGQRRRVPEQPCSSDPAPRADRSSRSALHRRVRSPLHRNVG